MNGVGIRIRVVGKHVGKLRSTVGSEIVINRCRRMIEDVNSDVGCGARAVIVADQIAVGFSPEKPGLRNVKRRGGKAGAGNDSVLRQGDIRIEMNRISIGIRIVGQDARQLCWSMRLKRVINRDGCVVIGRSETEQKKRKQRRDYQQTMKAADRWGRHGRLPFKGIDLWTIELGETLSKEIVLHRRRANSKFLGASTNGA